ncbi:MAG: NmrA family NAD(P)-binding protein [Gemmatimonadota bacterium]
MILVTGAAGKTGSAVIRMLAAREQPVRALVFRQGQVGSLERLGAADVLVADMEDAASLAAAMRGIRSVYHICPNMHPEEHAIGVCAIAAASSAGIEHFVYHSVLHPAVASMPHHWQKHRVEQELKGSRLRHTILRPCAYMQNLRTGWSKILENGEFAVPYAVATRMSLVDLEDVAEAAAVVLCTQGHEGVTYELCGAESLSQDDVAGILSGQLEIPVRASVVALEDWVHDARATGLSDYAIDSLLRMFEYYDRNGFCGSSLDLELLLDRPATTFGEFAHRRVTGNDDES